MSRELNIQVSAEERKSVSEKKNKILELATREIVYVPKLRSLPMVKSINASILMQQLDFRFNYYPDGFYKFLAPCENQFAYKIDDSWIEELGMSADEFRTAFDQIGVRYNDKKSYNEAADKFKGKYYCSYINKIDRKTYYFRNHQLLDSDLDALFLGDKKSQSAEIDNNNSVEVVIPNPESTKNTTKNTTVKEREKNNLSSSKDKENIKLTYISKDFTLTRDMRLWAGRKTLRVDIEVATAKFIDYYCSNPKKSADWVGEWRIWMRREAEYESKHPRVVKSEWEIIGDFDCVVYETCDEMNEIYENSKQPLSKNDLRAAFLDLSDENFDYLMSDGGYRFFAIVDNMVVDIEDEQTD